VSTLHHEHYVPAPILRYFDSTHLQPELNTIATSCRMLAERMDRTLPPGPEKSTGLRDLLKAKDAFIRAGLDLCEE